MWKALRQQNWPRLPGWAVFLLLVIGVAVSLELVRTVPFLDDAYRTSPELFIAALAVAIYGIWGAVLFAGRNSTPEYMRKVCVYLLAIAVALVVVFRSVN